MISNLENNFQFLITDLLLQKNNKIKDFFQCYLYSKILYLTKPFGTCDIQKTVKIY
jgi:hypothetical protein